MRNVRSDIRMQPTVPCVVAQFGRLGAAADAGVRELRVLEVIQRMSFGSASCGTRLADRWPLLKDVCREIGVRLERLNALTPDQLRALPEEHSENVTIRDRVVRFATYRTSADGGGTLIVVQAFFRTLLRANYIPLSGGSSSFSGRMTVAGLLLTSEGQLVRAPDELLWTFR